MTFLRLYLSSRNTLQGPAFTNPCFLWDALYAQSVILKWKAMIWMEVTMSWIFHLFLHVYLSLKFISLSKHQSSQITRLGNCLKRLSCLLMNNTATYNFKSHTGLIYWKPKIKSVERFLFIWTQPLIFLLSYSEEFWSLIHVR